MNCVYVLSFIIAIFGIFWFLLSKLRKPNVKRNIVNYEKDVVYLFQFPPTPKISCLSPFALKLETWLKLKKIPYKSIRTYKKWSRKGQIPFIELNGEQYADSNLIIDKLSKYFNCEDSISEYEKGISRTICMMLENQTVWSYFYYRYVIRSKEFCNSWIFTNSIRRWFMGIIFPRGYSYRSKQHGIGRHNNKEIAAIGNKDILALSQILSDREYMLGSHPHTVDCYVFGHLAQILYIPSVDYPHRQFIKTNCPNLERLLQRIISDLWPEWDKYTKLS